MFLSVLRHLKIQQKKLPASKREKQTRENNKIHAHVLELCLIIEMSLINDRGLSRSTN
jgi:hypothetical protein